MTQNPILDELHRIRTEILAEFNGDTAAYLRDAQTRLEASGRPISQRKQRAIRRAESVKAGVYDVQNPSSPPDDREQKRG